MVDEEQKKVISLDDLFYYFDQSQSSQYLTNNYINLVSQNSMKRENTLENQLPLTNGTSFRQLLRQFAPTEYVVTREFKVTLAKQQMR